MLKDVCTDIDRDSFRKRLLKYTRKVFKLLPRLDKPRILDVGCGSGVPTIELAILSRGKIVGIDIDQSLLDELDRKIEREGLSNRVESRNTQQDNNPMLKKEHTGNCKKHESHVLWVANNGVYSSVDEFSGLSITLSLPHAAFPMKLKYWKQAEKYA